MSINNGEEVAGYFADASQSNLSRSFVRNRHGKFTIFDAPNAAFTLSYSINNGGDVVGYFLDLSQGSKIRGFLRDRGGNITVFDAPGGGNRASAKGERLQAISQT